MGMNSWIQAYTAEENWPQDSVHHMEIGSVWLEGEGTKVEIV